MTDPLNSAETIAAARAHLRKALGYLETCKVEVIIDRDRYLIDGERMTEGELISFANMLAPDIAKLGR